MNLPFKSDELGKLTLRFTMGILMLVHGVHKVLNPASIDFIDNQLIKMDLPQAVAYGIYMGEVILAHMIILGIFVRLSGLMVFGNVIFAILLGHINQLFNLYDHGRYPLEVQIFFMLTGLALFFFGSGKFAVRPD
ncbi:DoxX family protein [Nitrosomonas sp. JL21]|uniref:DoxX family protein n=1 Tax=Nitrosomonas sp. JL21 TaxID=153949 RepID=UPI001368EFCB|nr:DoxX family protein [Nitrosomonas sp. JL21]MXS79115.1 DoxX family protein [Nitrosomonas sp. JL21]